MTGAPHVTARRAGPQDRDAVLAVLLEAFAADPVWAWMAPDPAVRSRVHATLLDPVVEAALQRRTLWVTPAVEAVAVYVPPGEDETLPDAGADPGELSELLGQERTEAVLALFDRFAEHRPAEPPHVYLSMLGTAARHRGRGLGMRLLRETLRGPELHESPVYLESSNPVNDERYRGLGFEPVGLIPSVDGCPPVTTFWRPAEDEPA